ncbi:MAG: competence/damage-inducible protein A [Candidatus Latescibacterota bacterium]|nr:MAG: competence/damage-inducible protein A [Candidatus Latescibacterota bacterium]
MSNKNDVELILVGNELLRGDRKDSHLEYLGQRLLEIGVRLDHAHVVGDERERIASLIAARVALSRVLVVAGGLGPTHDDVTRDAVADGLGVPLEFDENEWANIQAMFVRCGWKISESNRRQAFFPMGAVPVSNPRGTAPGFVVTSGDSMIAVLPGPPREFRAMLDGDILPQIRALFERPPLVQQTYRTVGVGESKLTPLIESLLARFQDLTVASLPHVAGVDLLVRAKRNVQTAGLDDFDLELRSALGHRIYATGDTSLEAVIGGLLAKRGDTLAVAESLTGGLLGKRLTDVSGSSQYLLADVVAYSNESKTKFLGVKEKTLVGHGAVSKPVCQEMADGIRVATGATYGIATTGIAGPTGGTDEKPVGLCYYGLSWAGGGDVHKRIFPGERDAVRQRVVWASLFLLYERLCGSLCQGRG